ncbi:MAG: dUTP diphosphatase [Deltaproteobacteria bacterium]|nr:dUTP diphosphatase [Deltaproteobacteria bacterium]
MDSIPIKIKICNPVFIEQGFPLPGYVSKGASGMDIRACVEAPVTLDPGRIKLIPTGLALSIPPGYEVQIRPRSGLALKHGIGMVNAPGTIDSDYRGEVGIILINWGEAPFVIRMGDRVAQMVLSKVYRADLQRVEKLDATKRGKGGFGHSGVQ